MSLLQLQESKTERVSQRVNHLMFINGRMTQRTLALMIGTGPSTLNNKFLGRTGWNLDELDALADVFGVSTDYLLGREPIETAQPTVNRGLKAESPPSEENGLSDLVAGAGFEPTTSGL